jgi:hypothetical protein
MISTIIYTRWARFLAFDGYVSACGCGLGVPRHRSGPVMCIYKLAELNCSPDLYSGMRSPLYSTICSHQTFYIRANERSFGCSSSCFLSSSSEPLELTTCRSHAYGLRTRVPSWKPMLAVDRPCIQLSKCHSLGIDLARCNVSERLTP